MKRALIGIIVIAALCVVGWGGGAMLTRNAAEAWLEARRAEGWLAHARDVSVAGFPLSFETRFAGIQLADPSTGLAWSAGAFRLEHRVARLDRIAAIWPEAQTIASPEERLEIASAAMNAELDVQPTNRFALDAMRAEMRAVAIVSTAGWETALDSALLRITRLPREDARYAVDFEATAMLPPDLWRNRLDPAGLLPERIERATFRAEIGFDGPWDMDAIEVERPQITGIEIDEINAAWGDMLFRASGTLAVTDGGVPEGELAVRAENWRAMVELAANAGLVPERLRPTVEAMLGVLAGMNGSEENIDATLSFSNGRVFLGPLPLGPAPSLRLR